MTGAHLNDAKAWHDVPEPDPISAEANRVFAAAWAAGNAGQALSACSPKSGAEYEALLLRFKDAQRRFQEAFTEAVHQLSSKGES